MEFCNFDDVFDYRSYSSGKEVEATFIPLSPSPLQSDFPPPPSSTPDAVGHSVIQSDPGEWFKYCAHIDNFLYYGVDSPTLPPETNLSPSYSPSTVPSSFLPATMWPFRRQDLLAFWPHDGGTSVQPQSQPRRGSSHLSIAEWNSNHSAPFAASSTPGTLIEATTPSTLPELIPYQSSFTFTSPPECSSLSPQVAPYEHEDEHSRMKPSSEGLERGTLIPGGMLVEFQVDKAAWVPDPPTLPQPSALPNTTRDCRCNCIGPITDWARHWRRSCPGNPARSFPCSNGCGKSFTRKDNMKRHVSLGECSLY